MKILIFTEGTVLMHASGKGLSREEIVLQSKEFGIQMEEKFLSYDSSINNREAGKGSIDDYTSYVPVKNAVEKIKKWKNQGATLYYLSSRRVKNEINAIKEVLRKYEFPDSQNLFFRKKGEDYKNVAETLLPDILIEDDCESIGGVSEMTYTHLNPDVKAKIHLVFVKEFAGIDHLPDTLSALLYS